MKKKLLLLATFMGVFSSLTWSDGYGHLTGIINKSPYNAIQIQTTDQAATVVLKDGEVWSGDQVKNRGLHLWDLASFNFTIPPVDSWDGAARIYIDVKKDITKDDTLVMRGELLERNGKVMLLTGKNYEDSKLKMVQSFSRSADTNYTILIDEIGDISIATFNEYGLVTTTRNSPPQVTIQFEQYTEDISVISPNCSIENDINKQRIFVPKHDNSGAPLKKYGYTMYMKQGCKLVITTTDNNKNTTACFGFVEKRGNQWIRDQRTGAWATTNQQNPINYREIGCLDAECAPDSMTDISPCDHIGITWVEGVDGATGSRIKYTGPNQIRLFYGIAQQR